MLRSNITFIGRFSLSKVKKNKRFCPLRQICTQKADSQIIFFAYNSSNLNMSPCDGLLVARLARLPVVDGGPLGSVSLCGGDDGEVRGVQVGIL